MTPLYPLRESFNEATLRSVWNKATIVAGYDPNFVRKDQCGAWISYSEHGNRNSDHGWEADHIYPKSLGGSSDVSNLQPLHWKNNVAKSDNTGRWTCAVWAQ
ncbi:HNH endonuclease [Hymenobacter sp.]|uniref:HNH endonuclease n=1 Tax=Hymenobacter sp. TaxID=1898978 RepID=UPI0039C8A4F1